MRKFLTIALCLGPLSGCVQPVGPQSQLTANLSYVRAGNIGFANSGLLPAGYLYLWDTDDNSLRLLSKTIPLSPKDIAAAPATIVSSGVTGVTVDGSFGGTGVTKTAISAAVGQKIEFRAENAVRQDYNPTTITALVSAYRDGQAQGEDLYGQWFVAEATRPKSHLFYVIIDSIVLAEKTRIAQTGVKGDNDVASVSVSVPGLTKPVVVAIQNGAFAECFGKDKATGCFFSVQVYKPYLSGPDKLLNFRAASNPKPEGLVQAFRNKL
ncbi:MAG TPA: hypothetical protein VNX29_01250 [Kaistia sp.]|nr:hypothetical protein [Kaistia sp.]